MGTETATFGAGCFWDAEAAFRRMPGVISTTVGFMGGRTESPTYDAVCIGNTGHAEVVQLAYDPESVSYEALLALFWTLHDPTTWPRNSPDTGSQYRSAIFFHSEPQRRIAEKAKHTAQPRHLNAIATEITPAGAFYPAGREHQRFEEKRLNRSGMIP